MKLLWIDNMPTVTIAAVEHSLTDYRIWRWTLATGWQQHTRPVDHKQVTHYYPHTLAEPIPAGHDMTVWLDSEVRRLAEACGGRWPR